MWDGPGPGQGPRGGPPFGGDNRGEMFGGRDRPMADFRGRDRMNMGQMGQRPLYPPMDMRRMDGPMRGRDMDQSDMRDREPGRDFFRPGDEPDFSPRRHYDTSIRDRLMNFSGFPVPGRNSGDMAGSGMPSREPNDRFMDRDRESFPHDMPQFNSPNMDGRRGFPMDRMERNDGFRDMHDRPQMGIGSTDGYDMDLSPHERRMMDSDRRGGPPPFNQRGEQHLNSRGGFDSDVDFRNRLGPSAEFQGRDRSPLRFGNSDVPPVDRARSDMPSGASVPQKSGFAGAEGALRERDYQDSSGSPLMDYRCGEEMTLAEEWKNRQNKQKPKPEKNPFLKLDKGMGGALEPGFLGGFGRDTNIRDQPHFQERDSRPPIEFQGKDMGFPHSDRFPAMDLPPIGNKTPQNQLLPDMRHLTGPLGRENERKHWLGERDPKPTENKLNRDERPPYHKEKVEPSHEIRVKDIQHSQGPSQGKMGKEHDFHSSSPVQSRDQDYRDIDYRTVSGRGFDYEREMLPVPEKLIKESKPITPSKFSESGSQDQDYRSASVKDKVSNTMSVMGIPKTATMDQILGAFSVRDGVPMQGMKIKNVVPGYSYDTAYVEFLNLEDAVHFMESNKGSLKVGNRTTTMTFIQPGELERAVHESAHKVPQLPDARLPGHDEPLDDLQTNLNGSKAKGLVEPLSHSQWQRSSDLTPEAWQQQVDQLQLQENEQHTDSYGNRNTPHHNSNHSDAVFKDSKTMILKNVKATTTVETILKALDPFAYLDERNVRLVNGRQPGAKCFCFVDMDSHEQVTRLVELLTKPRPLMLDGDRVYAEVAKPLKNQNFKRDVDKQNTSILGYPPEPSSTGQQQQFPQPPPYMQPLQPHAGSSTVMQMDLMTGGTNPALSSVPGIGQGVGYGESPAVDPSYQAGGFPVPTEPAGIAATVDRSQVYVYGSEIPDMTNYLYDSTSGFYYDPETTLYYDPGSRYFYNAQTQEYLYWDGASKTYIPVPGGHTAETQPVAMTAEDQAILSNPAADAPLEMKKAEEAPVTEDPEPPALAPVDGSALESILSREEDDTRRDKDDKPKSLAAVKIMKDMERWAKIQNRQKDTVRSASPLLRLGGDDDRRQSKSADVGFAVFERKVSGADDLFKKPLAPPKKDEKSKRPMGSLGMLASDYAAGSDEEVEEDKDEGARGGPSEDKDNRLTDWKKMACLLCRRQFPNKDALIRHQQLSDLHKQNMEIHLKIKRSKKELEALENQEKELSAKEPSRGPEPKRRKQHQQQQQQQHHKSWAGSSREMKQVSDRPGLGAEPAPRKKKEPVVWDHATYKQAVRKAMFARFKELE